MEHQDPHNNPLIPPRLNQSFQGQTPKTSSSENLSPEANAASGDKTFVIKQSELLEFLQQAAERGAQKVIDEFKQKRAEVMFEKFRYARKEVAQMLGVSTWLLDKNYQYWNLEKEKQGKYTFYSKASVDRFIELRS